MSISPLKALFIKCVLPTDLTAVQVAFVIKKKRMGRAVDRNRVRRLLREAYRLNKHELYEKVKQANTQLALVIIYQSSEIPTFSEINKKMQTLLKQVAETIAGSASHSGL